MNYAIASLLLMALKDAFVAFVECPLYAFVGHSIRMIRVACSNYIIYASWNSIGPLSSFAFSSSFDVQLSCSLVLLSQDLIILPHSK
jgi:hypothetical protein